MNIDELTVGQLKEIKMMIGAGCEKEKPHPYTIGMAYLIRTVTHYYTGRLVDVYDTELVLDDAAWIADTGRYADCLEQNKFSEVEPIKSKCIIGRGAIVDCVEWKHDLPRDQK